MTARPATQSDITAIGALAEAAGLFPADMLPEMIAPGLAKGPDLWWVSTGRDEGVTGFAFARPEEAADNVWNMLALAVTPRARGTGAAAGLLGAVENAAGARMMIIETTQLPVQARARAFYAKSGYSEEGRVRDYYAAGEDKIIFRKVMA